MRELRVKIKAETGLHARTASLLVNAVSKSKSNITVEKEGQEANSEPAGFAWSGGLRER